MEKIIDKIKNPILKDTEIQYDGSPERSCISNSRFREYAVRKKRATRIPYVIEVFSLEIC